MCGALPTKLLQVAGGLPFMTEIISLAMENISSTELHPVVHMRDVFNIIDGKKRERLTLFEAHNPVWHEKEFQIDVERVITACNIHQHAQTCHKPPNEKCRMGMPRPVVSGTTCVQIVPAPTTKDQTEKFIVLPHIESPEDGTQENREVDFYPVPKRDERTLIWEQKRGEILLPMTTTKKKDLVAGKDFLPLPEDLQKEYDLLPRNIEIETELIACCKSETAL